MAPTSKLQFNRRQNSLYGFALDERAGKAVIQAQEGFYFLLYDPLKGHEFLIHTTHPDSLNGYPVINPEKHDPRFLRDAKEFQSEDLLDIESFRAPSMYSSRMIRKGTTRSTPKFTDMDILSARKPEAQKPWVMRSIQDDQYSRQDIARYSFQIECVDNELEIFTNENGVYQILKTENTLSDKDKDKDKDKEKNEDVEEKVPSETTLTLIFHPGTDPSVFQGDDALKPGSQEVLTIGEFESYGEAYQEIMSHAESNVPEKKPDLNELIKPTQILKGLFNKESGHLKELQQAVKEKIHLHNIMTASPVIKGWGRSNIETVLARVTPGAVAALAAGSWFAGVSTFIAQEMTYKYLRDRADNQREHLKGKFESHDDPEYDIRDKAIRHEMNIEGNLPDMPDQDVLGRCVLMPFDLKIDPESREFMPREEIKGFPFMQAQDSAQIFLNKLYKEAKADHPRIVYRENDGVSTTVEPSGLLIDRVEPEGQSADYIHVFIRMDPEVLEASDENLPDLLENLIKRISPDNHGGNYAFEIARSDNGNFTIGQFYSKEDYKNMMAKVSGNEAWKGTWTFEQMPRPQENSFLDTWQPTSLPS